MSTPTLNEAARPNLPRLSRCMRWSWETTIPALVALSISAVFIVRTTFRVGGVLYFTLFDDGMISMRYARNLAHGEGLVWNPGERVEGYSNLLWTLWMAAMHLPGLPESKVSLLVMLSGVALLLGNLLVVSAIVRRVLPNSRLAVFSVLLLVASFYPLIYWTLRGMEVGLVTLLVSAIVLQSLRVREEASVGRLVGLAGLMAIAVLTRDDALVPCLIATAFCVFTTERDRRIRVAGVLLGPLGAAIGGHELFRILYYGDALPNTYYLKVMGISLETRGKRGVLSAGNIVLAEFYAGLAVAALGLVLRRRLEPALWLLAMIFAGQVAYSVYVGGDAWEWMNIANRYITPAVPGLFVLTIVGALEISRAPARRRRIAGWTLATVIVIVGALTPLRPIHRLQYPFHGLPPLVQLAVPLLAGLLVVVATSPATRRRVGGSMTLPVLALSVLVATNGVQFSQWVVRNGAHVENDKATTRYALLLRARTPPDVSIAVVWAGALPYFAHRNAVDLLGKNDPVIAHGPLAAKFTPGHSKWNYSQSLGRLKPGLIAQLVHAEDIRVARGFGYRQIPRTRLAPPTDDAPMARPEVLPLVGPPPAGS